jgi:pantoate--beta-alanine ligase
MIIFKKVNQMKNYIESQKTSGKTIGFVPTMGALHEGHLALIREARSNNNLVACSIFVNPTQFNNPDDFKNYPINIEKDIEQLEYSECDLLFLPSVDEIYSLDYNIRHYNLGRLENILEGYYRPGHFQGVCQVVDRLLNIINPDSLYLGQKDFQQCMVIKKLIQLVNKDGTIQIFVIPTLREPDGLAMSSRNLRLNTEQRKIAPAIYNELKAIKDNIRMKNIDELKTHAIDHLTKKGFKVDYFEIAKIEDLEIATNTSGPLIAVTAAYLGSVRLIDNLLLN